MEQFDREDSSNYAEPSRPVATEPVKEEAPVQPPAQQFPKQKKSKAPLILTLLLLLALAAATVFGWMWYQQSGELDNVRTDLSSTRNKISQLESSAKAEAELDKSDEDEVTTDTTDNESEVVLLAALAYEYAPVGAETNNVEAKVAKVEGNFARVEFPTEDGNRKMFLKKSNREWVVIQPAALVSPSKEAVERYGIPSSITQ